MKKNKTLNLNICTFAVCATLIAIRTPISAAENMSQQPSVEKLISHYYEQPDPTRLSELFLWWQGKGLLTNPTKAGSTVGVFGGLLSLNPNFIPEFITLGRAANLPPNGNVYLTMSLWHCGTNTCKAALKQNPFSAPASYFQETQQYEPKPLKDTVISQPSDIDMLWGWFTTTGSEAAVNRIVKFAADYEAKRGSKTSNTAKFPVNFTGEAARWSLISQSANHAKVLKLLKECAKKVKSCEPLLLEAEKKISKPEMISENSSYPLKIN